MCNSHSASREGTWPSLLSSAVTPNRFQPSYYNAGRRRDLAAAGLMGLVTCGAGGHVQLEKLCGGSRGAGSGAPGPEMSSGIAGIQMLDTPG